MKEKIPTPIAKALIEARLRSDASMAQHMVLHETIALLIGHLHRAGVVNADRLAEDVLSSLSAPEIEQLAPGIQSQAATMAERMRGAARLVP